MKKAILLFIIGVILSCGKNSEPYDKPSQGKITGNYIGAYITELSSFEFAYVGQDGTVYVDFSGEIVDFRNNNFQQIANHYGDTSYNHGIVYTFVLADTINEIHFTDVTDNSFERSLDSNILIAYSDFYYFINSFYNQDFLLGKTEKLLEFNKKQHYLLGQGLGFKLTEENMVMKPKKVKIQCVLNNGKYFTSEITISSN